MITLSVNAKNGEALAAKLRVALTPQAVDPVIQKVALQTHAQLVKNTPKKWFGQVRKGWQVQTLGPAARRVVNENKVMLFLEDGTRAHGPVKAKALYIPLVKKAALGWYKTLVFGRDYILTKWVRGITPRRIVHAEREKTIERLRLAIIAYLQKIKGASNG